MQLVSVCERGDKQCVCSVCVCVFHCCSSSYLIKRYEVLGKEVEAIAQQLIAPMRRKVREMVTERDRNSVRERVVRRDVLM